MWCIINVTLTHLLPTESLQLNIFSINIYIYWYWFALLRLADVETAGSYVQFARGRCWTLYFVWYTYTSWVDLDRSYYSRNKLPIFKHPAITACCTYTSLIDMCVYPCALANTCMGGIYASQLLWIKTSVVMQELGASKHRIVWTEDKRSIPHSFCSWHIG